MRAGRRRGRALRASAANSSARVARRASWPLRACRRDCPIAGGCATPCHRATVCRAIRSMAVRLATKDRIRHRGISPSSDGTRPRANRIARFSRPPSRPARNCSSKVPLPAWRGVPILCFSVLVRGNVVAAIAPGDGAGAACRSLRHGMALRAPFRRGPRAPAGSPC